MAFFDKNKINDTLFNVKQNIQKKSEQLMQKAKDNSPIGPSTQNDDDPNKYNNVVYVDKELEKHKKVMNEQQSLIDTLDKQLCEKMQ